MSRNIIVDVEHSGSTTKKNFIVSIASVAYDAQTHEEVSHIKIQFIPDSNACSWSDRTLQFFKTNATLNTEIARVASGVGDTPAIGIAKFVDWVQQVRGDIDPNNMLFIADTAASDATWFNDYLANIGHEPMQNFYQTDTYSYFKDMVSTDSYALGVAGVLPSVLATIWSPDTTARVSLGIPSDVLPKAKHDHDPLNDCRYIYEMFRIVSEYRNNQCTVAC